MLEPSATAIPNAPGILPPADINFILRHIPHRYPFMLIDRMEACLPHQWVRVSKNVSGNDQFFQGTPVAGRSMPQLLVVEALAQAAGVLCWFSDLMLGERVLIFFAGIDNTRFGRDAHPGDQLILECTLKRAMRGVVKFRAVASVDGQVVVETDMTAVIRDMAKPES